MKNTTQAINILNTNEDNIAKTIVTFNEQNLKNILAKPALELQEQDDLLHSLLMIGVYNSTFNANKSNNITFDNSLENLNKYLPELKSRIIHELSNDDIDGLATQFFKNHINEWFKDYNSIIVEKSTNHLIRYVCKDRYKETVPSITSGKLRI